MFGYYISLLLIRFSLLEKSHNNIIFDGKQLEETLNVTMSAEDLLSEEDLECV